MSKDKKRRNLQPQQLPFRKTDKPLLIVNRNEPEQIVIKLDVNQPLFPQLVYWPLERAKFEPVGEFRDNAHYQDFINELSGNINYICLNKATMGHKFPGWLFNFIINTSEGRLHKDLPTSRELPCTTKSKALVIGNGPSADFRTSNTEILSQYEIFSTWHGANRLPVAPDYVIHSSSVIPSDIQFKEFPTQTSFIAEPTCNPEFHRLAERGGNKVYIHLNPENRIDEILANHWEKPVGLVNQGTVTISGINGAIQCGHDDITLIGVDLTGPGHNELFQVLLEDFPKRYPNIKFQNASTSNLAGFAPVKDLFT